MQIALSLGLLGLSALEGQELQALQQGLVRLCPTGVNLPGLSATEMRALESLRGGAALRPAETARAAAALVDCLTANGFLPRPSLEGAPGVRLFREPSIPLSRLSFPAFGGVDVATEDGAIHFGSALWSNKDVLAAGASAPSVFVLTLLRRNTGFLAADFLRNNYFVTRRTPVFVVDNADEARALDEFLRQTYEATEPESIGAFPSPDAGDLYRIYFFDEHGRVTLGRLMIERLRPHLFRISEGERPIGALNLETYAQAEILSPLRPRAPAGRKAEFVRRQAIDLKKPGLWPRGTANGFAKHEETSGFMIWNRGRFLFVDPPSSTLEYLEAHRIPLDLLEGLIITHGHTDHCTDAIPKILERRPKTRIYTTRRIFDDVGRQLDLALGRGAARLDFGYRRFVEIRPRAKTRINGMTFQFHDTLHTLPALGFRIWNGNDLAVYFSGDTFADPSIFGQFLPGQTPYMSWERAFEVLMHYFLIPQRASQTVPPWFLIEASMLPLHTRPELSRAFLEFLKKHLKVDTSRVLAYHISDEKARAAKLRKWTAGHEGWIDLSAYYQ
ncbi:MAG TPA: MBL fold metallo-hydrolase [bacterium]|nr:MBL fold metallo-hydrolase [bacterium]